MIRVINKKLTGNEEKNMWKNCVKHKKLEKIAKKSGDNNLKENYNKFVNNLLTKINLG